MSEAPSLYKDLQVQRIINAAGTYTVIGGSRMSEKTLSDIAEASRSFVQIPQLQKQAHAKIAKLTRNEDAYIATGGAAALYISGGAALARKYQRKMKYLSEEVIRTSEVIMFRAHRSPYDWGLQQLGVRVVDVGYPNVIGPATAEDLEAAINDHTCAIFYAAGGPGGWLAEGSLALDQTITVAKKHDIPVIVDAAAQLPPVENLWKFTEMGASAVIFSGGKDLKGPQASGLMVGKREFMHYVHETGFPNYGIGRMLKVGREEIVGLTSAIEQYVQQDHEARNQWAEDVVASLQQRLQKIEGVTVTRSFPNEAGQPMARAIITHRVMTADEMMEKLMDDDPGVFTMKAGSQAIFINPMTLESDEIELVITRLEKIFKEA
jgi:L-seryl-tRNA(Ser) seleniumtransferase